MTEDRLNELADKLEAWLALVGIYSYQQSAKSLFENLKDVDCARYGTTAVCLQDELATLDEDELREVFYQTWNMLRHVGVVVKH